MSISGALSNALSGLTSTSRLADVAASNISNAMTEGYGVREVVLASRTSGDEGGVSIVSIKRHTDQVLLSDRRNSEANLASAGVTKEFLERMQTALGLPGETGSLSDRLAQVEASLVRATQAPESEPHLTRIIDDLKNVTDLLNQLGDAVQTERARADKAISVEVDNLNNHLVQIDELNSSIRRQLLFDHDVSSMLDQRQVLVDKVNKIIPVTELDRGQGSIALMAAGGTLLVDGSPAEISFESHAIITADMTLSDGTLGALVVNERNVDTSRTESEIHGGRLDALFRLRDEASVELQEKLDGLSRDLIERFESVTVDTTRAATDPSFVTDNGTLFDPSNETGLAQRISINSLVDPDQGGDYWRIRDGIGAATSGNEGDTTILLGLREALTETRSPSSSSLDAGERNFFDLSSDLASFIGINLESEENNWAFNKSKFDTFKGIELSKGVDTDAEMQRLLIIEQSYAANARVVQVADEMLDWLMRI